jgi:hypothetical protein
MKIADYFEKNVQWIAVGLGCLWLLWVGWTYGIHRPEVDVNGQKLSAGSVDEHIRDTDMQALTVKVADQNIPPGLVEVPDFTDAFVNSMNGQPPGPLPAFAIRSDPPYAQIEITTPKNMREKYVVNKLPNVVIPTELTVVSGRSQIIQPPEKPKVLNANAANGNAANNEGGKPNIFNDNPQPQPQPQPQPAVAAAAPLPGQPAGAQMDRTWVSVFAKLNFTDQDKEFNNARIPPFLMQKQYIEVQLQRQEVLPDGSFARIETVAGLPMNQPPADRKKPADFIKWSADAEAQKLILAPPFYFVVKGTSWEIPQKNVPAVAQAQQPVEFNLQQKYQEWKAAKPAEQKKIVDAMTPEQKKQFYDYRIEEQKKENKANNPQPQQINPQRMPMNRGGGPGGGGGGGGGGRQIPPGREGRGDAVDPALLREMYADGDVPARRRRMLPQEYESPLLRDRYLRRPVYEGEGMQQFPQGQQQILGNLIPDALGNVDIWAHDETAQAGRTFRYRLRAVIKNPVYDTKNIATDPKMAQAPYLPADLATGDLAPSTAWSDWSKPVAIPTNVDMMLVSAQSLNGREVARFRVKRFQEGQINEAPKAFEVAPGDTIGGMEKVAGVIKPVDFTTTWTLVDIRQTGADYRVRIMDPQGRMEIRTLAGDRNRFKDEPKPGVGASAGTVGLLRSNQN